MSTVFQPSQPSLSEPVVKATGCSYLEVFETVCSTFILPNELLEDGSDYGIKSTLNGPLRNYKAKQNSYKP